MALTPEAMEEAKRLAQAWADGVINQQFTPYFCANGAHFYSFLQTGAISIRPKRAFSSK